MEESQVYVRVRPLARTGGHATRNTGELPHKAHERQIGKFDRESVTMTGGGGQKQFTYMNSVILPEDSQETCYSGLGLPNMLTRFLDGYNVTFIAYGQTGTGKTHTLFGSQLEEVKRFGSNCGDMLDMPGTWGLLPRTLVSALQLLKSEDKTKGDWKLTATVLELYFGQCLDLLNGKKPIHVDNLGRADFGDFGFTDMEVTSYEDISRLMDVMSKNRSTRGTSMNDTSSRSHCLVNLYLTRVVEPSPDSGSNQLRKSTFTFADLAGSERSEKTGLEIKSSTAAWEGLATNWDLMHFGRCIDIVVEAHRKGKKPCLIRDSLLSRVMTKPLDGNSLVTMVVCLSQSQKNGGETWYSLCYGERINKLAARVERANTRNIESVKEALESEMKALAVLEETEAGKMNRWYWKRVNTVKQLQRDLALLKGS